MGTLTLDGVPKGAKVTVTCKGKGCAFKKLSSPRRAKIKLAKRFKKRKLAAKTVITITVATRPAPSASATRCAPASSPRRSIS